MALKTATSACDGTYLKREFYSNHEHTCLCVTLQCNSYLKDKRPGLEDHCLTSGRRNPLFVNLLYIISHVFEQKF